MLYNSNGAGLWELGNKSNNSVTMHAKVRTAVRILGFASSQFAVRILEQPVGLK